MKKRFVPFVVLSVFVIGYIIVFPAADRVRKPVKEVQARGMILPPFVTKLISLEFRSIAADFLFVRAAQYFGGKIGYGAPITSSDLGWLHRNLLVITELDPYFEDPYYFGNAVLTWDAGAYGEANALLEKGVVSRTWDWQFPFFVGFNKFYFQHDMAGGADYISIAAKRPGAPSLLPMLASRLSSKAGRTETAILFLIQFWENETDPKKKHAYEVRIDALRKMLIIEKAVEGYKKKIGKIPSRLEDLVQKGFIAAIPADPYGGSFYIEKNGSIETTSKLSFSRPQQKK